MAKLKSPLFSFGATGRLGKALTVARRLTGPRWLLRGRPTDPRTEPQISWRTMWQLAAELWHGLPESEILEWERAGTRRGMTGFAWYMSQALRPNPGIYLPLAGGTMTGSIDMGDNEIENLPFPIEAGDAAPRSYVDNKVAGAALGQGAGAYRNAHQSIPDATTTEIVFTTQQFDNDDMWAAAPNPSRLTVKTAGLYLVTGQIHWLGHIAGQRYEMIEHNGIIKAQNFIHADTYQGGAWRRTITTVRNAAVDDYFEIAVWQDSGGALNVMTASDYSPCLQAVRIG